MTVTLPLSLVVVQWVLTCALGIFLVLLYRQMAHLMGIKHSAHAQQAEGLVVGEAVPSFALRLRGEGAGGTFDPQGRWTMLLVADPLCTSCGRALAALERVHGSNPFGAGALVVAATQERLVAAVDSFARCSLPIAIVDDTVVLQQLRTRTAPFLYVVDPQGRIAARGAVEDPLEMTRLLSDAVNRYRVEGTPLAIRSAQEVGDQHEPLHTIAGHRRASEPRR